MEHSFEHPETCPFGLEALHFALHNVLYKAFTVKNKTFILRSIFLFNKNKNSRADADFQMFTPPSEPPSYGTIPTISTADGGKFLVPFLKIVFKKLAVLLQLCQF